MDKDLKNKIDSIHEAIVGSALQPNGILKRLDELEKLKTEFKRFKFIGVGVITIIGLLLKVYGKI